MRTEEEYFREQNALEGLALKLASQEAIVQFGRELMAQGIPLDEVVEKLQVLCQKSIGARRERLSQELFLSGLSVFFGLFISLCLLFGSVEKGKGWLWGGPVFLVAGILGWRMARHGLRRLGTKEGLFKDAISVLTSGDKGVAVRSEIPPSAQDQGDGVEGRARTAELMSPEFRLIVLMTSVLLAIRVAKIAAENTNWFLGVPAGLLAFMLAVLLWHFILRNCRKLRSVLSAWWNKKR